MQNNEANPDRIVPSYFTFSFPLDGYPIRTHSRVDLVTEQQIDWREVDSIARVVAREIDAEVILLRDSLCFRRYQLTRSNEKEIVDFALSIEDQIDSEKTHFDGIIVDTLHEIMINKITTLVSRCEIKDLVDLYFLERTGMKIEAHFREAQRKDGGLDPAMVLFVLNSVKINEVPDFMLKHVSVDEIQSYIKDLKVRMAEIAYPDNE